MPTFDVEVIVSYRVNVTVDAEDVDDAMEQALAQAPDEQAPERVDFEVGEVSEW